MRRQQSTGILALFLVGGYFAWRNRFRIQQFLESYGVSTPNIGDNLTDTVRSGIAKVTGKVQNTDNEARRAV